MNKKNIVKEDLNGIIYKNVLVKDEHNILIHRTHTYSRETTERRITNGIKRPSDVALKFQFKVTKYISSRNLDFHFLTIRA